MKSIIMILLMSGIIFVAIGYIKTNQECPPPIVQFRYIPKTFNEEQTVQKPITAVFGSMFNDASPWQESVGYATNKDDKLINNTKDN